MDPENKPVMSADAPPPPYSETVKGGGGDAPPPYSEVVRGMTGYSNLRSGVQRVRESSDSQEKFKGFWQLCCSCCGSVLCSCCYLILSAWPIALIVIGSLDLRNCPANYLIPIWMIVYGVVSVVMTILSVVKQCCCRQKKEEEEEGEGKSKGRQGGNCLEGLLVTFLMVWVFVGSGWVFSLYPAWQNGTIMPSCLTGTNGTTPANCCEARTYLFAFGSLLTIYSFALLCCCFLCVGLCVGVCFVLVNSDDDD